MPNYGPAPSETLVQPMVRYVHGAHTIDFVPATTTDYGNGTQGSSGGGGLLAGDAWPVGKLLGVALNNIGPGEQGALTIEGTFDFPKASGDGGFAAGQRAWWDSQTKKAVPSSNGTSSTLYSIGKCEGSAGTTDTTVRISMESVADQSPSGVLNATSSATISGHSSARILITSVAAATLTLSAPTATTDDGVELKIINNSTFANVISATGLLIKGGTAGATQGYGTLTAANASAGAVATLIAVNAHWVVDSAPGWTAS